MRKIIHIGANKAGSTTLQRGLFSQSKELEYLGEDCRDYFEIKPLLDSLVSDDDLYLKFGKIEQIFQERLSSSGGGTFIYSNEDVMTSRIPTQCARRLRHLMPDAEILIIIRNQLRAIPSFYANHGAYLKMVPRNYWKRYVSFDDWMGYCMNFTKYSPLECFMYHKMTGLYKSIFKDSKIHVLLFEEFVSNRPVFIKKLSDILGITSESAAEFLAGRHERSRNTLKQIKYNQFRSIFFHNFPFSRYLPLGKSLSRWWNRYLKTGIPTGIQNSD